MGTNPSQAHPDTASAVGRKLRTGETVAWLFYHLHHISDLALGAREVVPRLLLSEAKRRRTSPDKMPQMPQAELRNGKRVTSDE